MSKLVSLTLCAAVLAVSAATVDTALAQSPAGNPQRVQGVFDVTVNAAGSWQESGVFLEAGTALTTSRPPAPGAIGPVLTDANGRLSQPLNGRRDEIALPGAPAMTLVGKVGDDGAPFRIGTQTQLTASRRGRLLLMANNRYTALDDNRGRVQVRVTIPRPALARPPGGSGRGGGQLEATVNGEIRGRIPASSSRPDRPSPSPPPARGATGPPCSARQRPAVSDPGSGTAARSRCRVPPSCCWWGRSARTACRLGSGAS